MKQRIQDAIDCVTLPMAIIALVVLPLIFTFGVDGKPSYADWLGTIIGLIAIIVSIASLLILNKTLEGQIEANRAWLAIADITYLEENSQAKDDIISALFYCKNVGRTVAKNCELDITYRQYSGTDIQEKTETLALGNVPPDVKIRIDIKHIYRETTGSEIATLRIRFEDIHGKIWSGSPETYSADLLGGQSALSRSYKRLPAPDTPAG